MRVASTQYHTTMNTALQSASERLQDIMQKMATGERYLRPSENPIASVRLARLNREEAALTQYRDNIGALQARLQLNEALLDSMGKDMLEARDLLVWTLDGANTPDDVAAMAGSLRSLADSLFYTANSKDQEGRYLFSGTASSTATVTYDAAAPVGTRYSYTGNSGKQLVMVGNGVTQPANVSLDEIAPLLNQLDAMIETLESGVTVNDPAVHTQLANGLDLLDDTLTSLTGRIAGLGGQQNILAALDGNHANVSLSNRQAMIDIGQLDYGDAAVKLNGYTSAVQATQKAYAKVSQLSLFDML